MSQVLFVVSEEGYWGEECIEPLTTLSANGVDVDVATPSGNRPSIDPRSIDPEEVGEETAREVREIHQTDDRIENPKPLAAVDADLYDAVVFPGGHGTVWDVNQDAHARRLLAEAVTGEDGVALVICHAVGLLAFTRPHGDPLVNGRDVTGFPDAWEDQLVDDNERIEGRKLPYRVEAEVRAAGANWDAELDAESSVTTDGDLITARGPDSSVEAAETLLHRLGTQVPATEN